MPRAKATKEKKPGKVGRPTFEESHRKEKEALTKRLKPLNKGGRPKFCAGQYDTWDVRSLEVLSKRHIVYLIASLGGSQADCARYAGISVVAVSKNYSEDYYDGKADIKMRIRCAQNNKAFEGDTTLLKHLGIVHCEEQKEAGSSDLPKGEMRGIIEMLAGKGITAEQESTEESDEDEI